MLLLALAEIYDCDKTTRYDILVIKRIPLILGLYFFLEIQKTNGLMMKYSK